METSHVLSAIEQASHHDSRAVMPDIVSNNASNTYQYHDLLSRISNSHTPVQTHCPYRNVDTMKSYSRLLEILMLQPIEIQILVLSYVQPYDLLNLRQTCHKIHDLIHDTERDICIAFTENLKKQYQLTSIPTPVADLSLFFRFSKQYRSIREVACLIANRISGFMSLGDALSDKHELNSWRRRKARLLEKRTTRALILLQRYLDFFLETIIKNEVCLAPLLDEEYSNLHNIFDLDQQAFLASHMSDMQEEDFIDVSIVLSVFRSTCKARWIPFSLSSHAFGFASVRHVLVWKGFAPFAELLQPGLTPGKQNEILGRLSAEIAHARTRVDSRLVYRPVETVKRLRGYWEEQGLRFDRKRSSKSRELFMSRQDLWDRSARALMMSKLGRLPTVRGPNAWIVSVVLEDEKESDIVLGTWSKADPL